MGGNGRNAGCAGGYSSHGFSDLTRERHFDRHGADYGAKTAEEYESKAVSFRDRELSSNLEEFTAKGGLRFKYDSIENDFMIYKQNGEIVTMFKPERGFDYWKDQVDLYGKE